MVRCEVRTSAFSEDDGDANCKRCRGQILEVYVAWHCKLKEETKEEVIFGCGHYLLCPM